VQLTLTLKLEGNKVTGSYESSHLGSGAISNGSWTVNPRLASISRDGCAIGCSRSAVSDCEGENRYHLISTAALCRRAPAEEDLACPDRWSLLLTAHSTGCRKSPESVRA